MVEGMSLTKVQCKHIGNVTMKPSIQLICVNKNVKKMEFLCGVVLDDRYEVLAVCQVPYAHVAAEHGEGTRPTFVQQSLILAGWSAVPLCGLKMFTAVLSLDND
jgi:hypothetical protein